MNLAAGHWPEGSALGWPDPPQNLLPGRIYSWPSGTQRVANRAERLLSQAVAYWDASKYRDGDRFLRNQGVAGELLDLRLGSSVVANTNDPKWLGPEDTGYVYLPQLNALTVPNQASFTTTDLDLRLRLARDDWTPGLAGTIAARSTQFDSDRAWQVFVQADGTLLLRWYPLGTNASLMSAASTAAPSVQDGQPIWLRIVLDVDNGSGKYEVIFYTAPDSPIAPSSWTRLGNKITGAATTSLPTTVNALISVSVPPGFTNGLEGKAYRLLLLDGIDGPVVLDIDCDAIVSGSQTSFQARTGQTVTINRATSGRKTVAMPSKTVKKVDDGHVYLPGVAGNYLSVPDENALDITGDIDIRVRVNLPDYTPSTYQVLLSKWAAGQRSYALVLENTGRMYFTWSNNGTTILQSTATANIAAADGSTIWLRATLDVDNGASGNTVTLYESTDGVTWQAVGSPITKVGTTSIFAGTESVRIGADVSNSTYATGRVYRAQILNGINGTLVLDVDCSKAPASFEAGKGATFTAVTGQTVTLSSTANSGMLVRQERWGAGRACMLFGTDDYMEVVDNWQHQLLNFGQGDSFTVLAVYRMPSFSASQPILTKGSSSGGYLHDNAAGTPALGRGWKGADNAVVTRTANAVTTFTLVAKPTLLTVTANGTSATATATDSDQRNASPLRIARTSGSAYGDMEFRAAAIFRRALSAEEIRIISDYFTNPYPGFEGNTDTSALDILSSGVFWIDANRSGVV